MDSSGPRKHTTKCGTASVRHGDRQHDPTSYSNEAKRNRTRVRGTHGVDGIPPLVTDTRALLVLRSGQDPFPVLFLQWLAHAPARFQRCLFLLLVVVGCSCACRFTGMTDRRLLYVPRTRFRRENVCSRKWLCQGEKSPWSPITLQKERRRRQ